MAVRILANPDDAWIADEQARKLRDAARNAAAVRARCGPLLGFVQEAWHILEPKREFIIDDVIICVCAHLEAVTRGEITRLLINVPPGMMKSLLVSVFWPAWEWGPAGKSYLGILSTSYSQKNVVRDNEKMRRLIKSDWYRRLWPVEMSKTTDGKFIFANTNGGVRDGRPFGSMTGGRGDRVIIDDPHSTKTAESDNQRAATVTLFREQISDRLNDIEHSAIVIIMQRLHSEDVSGCVLALDEGYVHVNLPMEFDVTQEPCKTAWFHDTRTKDGELLSPIRFPAKAVERLKNIKGAYAWSGQYQQRPAPRTGGFFKVDKIGRVGSMPINLGKRVRAWDLAGSEEKPGRDPDWTAGVRMARCTDDQKFYIDSVVRVRESAGAVRITISATASQDRMAGETTIMIPQDPGQAGKGQAEDYGRLLAGYPLKIEPVGKGNKAQRAEPFASQMELGNIVIVETGDPVRDRWIEPFIHELRTFPVGHDDQVDAAGDAFKLLAHQSAQGWMEYYKELATEARAKRGAS